jgi:hypothetical protein
MRSSHEQTAPLTCDRMHIGTSARSHARPAADADVARATFASRKRPDRRGSTAYRDLGISPWQHAPGPLRLGGWSLPKYQEPLYQGFGARLTASSLSLKAVLKPRKVFSAAKMVATHTITRAIILTGMDVVAFKTTKYNTIATQRIAVHPKWKLRTDDGRSVPSGTRMSQPASLVARRMLPTASSLLWGVGQTQRGA